MVKSGFKEAAERRVTRRTYDLKEHGITLHDKYLTRVAEVAGAGFVALGRPVVANPTRAELTERGSPSRRLPRLSACTMIATAPCAQAYDLPSHHAEREVAAFP